MYIKCKIFFNPEYGGVREKDINDWLKNKDIDIIKCVYHDTCLILFYILIEDYK